MRRLALGVGALMVVAGLLSAPGPLASPASADCASQPAPPDRVGVGYRGSVLGVEEVRSGLFTVTMSVERTLAGPTRRTVTFETGDHADCHMIDGSAIRVGDELVLVGSHWWRPRTLSYPFAWRATDGGRWDLSVIAATNRRRLDAGLRRVDTYPEILAFIGAGLPPTDAEPSPVPSPILSARGEAEDDLFRLTIETPTTTFTAGEPITLITTFAYIGKARTLRITRSGDQTLGFDIRQFDGPFAVEIIRRTDCGAEAPASPEIHTVTFTRGDNRDAASRWNPCLDEALASLGPGTYTIETVAEYDPVGRGRGRSLRASVTIAVVGAAPAGSPVTGTSPSMGPPEAVLDAYLDALLAGDCETARAFTTSTFTVGSGELCGGATVLAVEVHPTGPARPSEDEVVFATTLTITGGDASIPDGDQIWFYVLGRQPDGSWRLTGGGSGP